MATSIGLSGSIDVNGIVQALMDVERQPLDRLDIRAAEVQATISEVGRLQSSLSTFQDAARDLTDTDTWGAATANSSDEELIGATASTGALQGSYAVQVNQLAAHQTVVTTPLADASEVIGGGQIVVEMGTDDAGFTPDPARPSVAIDIAAGSTLEAVSEAINAADAGIGASLVTDVNGTRLMIRSTDSGANNAFRLSATADGSSTAGLDIASLSYAPGQAPGDVTATEVAANAEFVLNGLALESTSNRPEGVLDNVALSFNSVTTGTVEINIVSDSESIRERLDTFITSYNAVNSLIREQTRYDEASGTAGPLQGNRTVIMVQEQLRNILRTTLPNAGAEDYARLSDIGIEIERDGSLSIDASRYDVLATDPSKIETLFANGGTDPDDHGFGRRFDTLVTGLLGIDGAITGTTDTLRLREDLINDQQDRLLRRLEDIEARLVRQYTTLDANLARLSGALQTVSQLG